MYKHPLLVAFLFLFAFEPTFSSVAVAQDMGLKAVTSTAAVAPNATSAAALALPTFDVKRDLPKLVALAAKVVQPVTPLGERIAKFAASVVDNYRLPAVIGDSFDIRQTLLIAQGGKRNSVTKTVSAPHLSAALQSKDAPVCPQSSIVSNSNCAECPEGFVADENFATCVPCDDGKVRAAGAADCSECKNWWQVASSDHTKCVNDGIATFAFTGCMTLYLVVGFLRLMSMYFLRQAQNDFCCCQGGSRDKKPCRRSSILIFGRAQDHCPDTPSSVGTEVRYLLDGEVFPLTMHDRVCEMSDAERAKGTVNVARERTKWVLGMGAFAVLMLGSIAAGFVSAMLDDHWATVAFSVCYLISNIVVYGTNIKKKYDEKKVAVTAIIVEVLFLLAETGLVIWFMVRIGKPEVRSYDISLMWLMQLGLQFQIAFLADVSFQKGDSGFSRKAFGFVVAVMLLEAILYPLSISMRILTWSKPDEDPMSEAELVNLQYTSDYFATMISGMAIAVAVVERTNARMEDLSSKRDSYSKIRLNLVHTLTAITHDLKSDDSVLQYSSEYTTPFPPSVCDTADFNKADDKAAKYERRARQAIVQALGQMEEEDACAFFQVAHDGKDAPESEVDATLKDKSSSSPINTLLGATLPNKDPAPTRDTDGAVNAQARMFLGALGFDKMCPEFNEGAVSCSGQKACQQQRCRLVATMAVQLPTYIKRFNRTLKVRTISTKFLVMAMVACSYFGGVYNVMDMSLNIRAQHGGDAKDAFMNSIATMVLAFLMCIAAVGYLFAGGSDDGAEEGPREVGRHEVMDSILGLGAGEKQLDMLKKAEGKAWTDRRLRERTHLSSQYSTGRV